MPSQVKSAAGGHVEERDLVMLLHNKGKMPLKEIIQHFKAFCTDKAQKAEFIQMVARVACVSVEGDAKVAKLKESTLTQYNLDA